MITLVQCPLNPAKCFQENSRLVGTQTARINPCAMYESVAHVSARSKNLPIRVADDLRQFAMLRVAEPPSISYSMQTAELLQ